MPLQSLTEHQRRILLEIARRSIDFGLRHGRSLPVEPRVFDGPLQAQLASFVTLKKEGELRGCIGGLTATMPLVADVAQHAYGAAFSDPRFPAVGAGELGQLHISISVLSTPEPLSFDSEDDLLNQIRPGVDGLILEDRGHRGTFLPAVWESLPDRRQFWLHLKLKANLPPQHWSESIRVSRYTTLGFGESG